MDGERFLATTLCIGPLKIVAWWHPLPLGSHSRLGARLHAVTGVFTLSWVEHLAAPMHATRQGIRSMWLNGQETFTKTLSKQEAAVAQ